MITEYDKKKYYQALIEKNKKFIGTFFVGIKTTGVFCHSICPARKPKYINCEFFLTSKEALLAGYRPCKRCNPLSHPNLVSPKIKILIDEIEKNPKKRWKDEDFKKLGISSSTVRRQFHNKFGMTFVEYARSRRLGMGLKKIRNGSNIIEAQLEAGFESDSGFRDALKNTLGIHLSKKIIVSELYAQWIDTKIGSMIAISDEKNLYLLEFIDRRGLELEIEKLKKKFSTAIIIPKKTIPIESIKKDLYCYFQNPKHTFQTPIAYVGSAFSKSVWDILQTIPIGKVITYSELANLIQPPNTARAVARANGCNQLSIIVPCHRVINENGSLGGYGGGLERKKWLLKHEGVNI